MSAEHTYEVDDANNLKTTVRDAVLTLTVDRPEKRNAVTPQMIAAIIDLLGRVCADQRIKAAVVTGSGSQAFCAGFDVASIDSPGTKAGGSERDLADALATTVAGMPIPTIAAINGVAVGAGCDLAVACDIRVCAPGARFGIPTAKLGLLYGWRGIRRLVDAIGAPAAKEMLLTGTLIGAQKAYDLGLVTAIVPAVDLLSSAAEIADQIALNAPLSVAGSKRIIDVLASRPPSDDDLSEFAHIQKRVWASADAVEGSKAFREHRPPRFQGQ